MEEHIDKFGKSLRVKQQRLYDMCHSYLIDNFHKFSEANKLKVSLALSSKLVPQTQKLEGEITFNKTPDIIVDGNKMEYTIGNRIAEYSKASDSSPN